MEKHISEIEDNEEVKILCGGRYDGYVLERTLQCFHSKHVGGCWLHLAPNLDLWNPPRAQAQLFSTCYPSATSGRPPPT